MMAVTLAFPEAEEKELRGEVWSCNGYLRHLADRQFELHRRNYLARVYGHRRTQCFYFLKPGARLVTWEPWPEFPANRQMRYPVAAVERLGQFGKWHLSTVDWMIALALHEHVRRLRIVGLRNMRGGEPINAIACISYWIGLAEGRGTQIELVDCDSIGKTYQLLESERQYGREDVVLVEKGKA